MTLKEILISGKLTVSEGGGGGSDCVFGEYTPNENTTSASFNIGADFNYFVIFADDDSAGFEVRALRFAVIDFSRVMSTLLIATTNNKGTGMQGAGYYETSSIFTRNGNTVIYNGGSNNLVANITYKWMAFK